MVWKHGAFCKSAQKGTSCTPNNTEMCLACNNLLIIGSNMKTLSDETYASRNLFTLGAEGNRILLPAGQSFDTRGDAG